MDIINKHLLRVLPRRWEKILDDPRRYERGWCFSELLSVVMKAMVAGCKTLREIEAVTGASGRRVPDTTLRDLLVQIDAEPLEEELARGVKDANRNHELDQRELPIRLTVIDGKCLSTTDYQVDEYSINCSQKGCTKYVQHVLRAFHASSTVKLLMGHQRVPRGTNEKGVFPLFLDKLVSLYGRTNLLDVISSDAGFTSIANSKAIIEHGLHYIMALKDPRTHPITRTTIELFSAIKKPAKVENEYINGRHITRSLYRSTAPQQVRGWEHAREVWRIHKETSDSTGKTTSEDRYFVTSLTSLKLSSAQILKTIRLHWSIENNSNWVLDVAWKEDSKPWCNQAVEFLSLVRMIAYNAVARFKLRRLRRATSQYWSWEQTLAFIKATIFPLRMKTGFACL